MKKGWIQRRYILERKKIITTQLSLSTLRYNTMVLLSLIKKTFEISLGVSAIIYLCFSYNFNGKVLWKWLFFFKCEVSVGILLYYCLFEWTMYWVRNPNGLKGNVYSPQIDDTFKIFTALLSRSRAHTFMFRSIITSRNYPCISMNPCFRFSSLDIYLYVQEQQITCMQNCTCLHVMIEVYADTLHILPFITTKEEKKLYKNGQTQVV